MSMPRFTAESAIYASDVNYYAGAHNATSAGGARAVVPQASACSPCVQVGGGQFCVNLPFFGRRCLNVPSFGRWHICCSTRWGWPPITCGLSRC